MDRSFLSLSDTFFDQTTLNSHRIKFYISFKTVHNVRDILMVCVLVLWPKTK